METLLTAFQAIDDGTEPDPIPSQSKFISVMIIVSIIDTSFLIYSCILVRKVYKLVKFHDLPMLLSVLSITLALFFFLGYLSLSIVQAILKTQDEHFFNSDNGDNMLTAVDYGKVMFTFSAFVFDLYKWCLFIAATSNKARADNNVAER